MSKPKLPLLRLQLDQTSLDSTFQGITARLNKHEEMIIELQNRIKNIPSNEDLLKFKNSLFSEIDAKHQKLSDKINEIEERINNQIKDLEDSFSERLLENSNMINLSVRRQFDQIKQKLPGMDEKNADIEIKIRNLERHLSKVEKNNQTTYDCLQQVASAINLLDNSNISNIIESNKYDNVNDGSNDDNNDNNANNSNNDINSSSANDNDNTNNNANNNANNNTNNNANNNTNSSSSNINKNVKYSGKSINNKNKAIVLDENIYYILKDPITTVNNNFRSLGKEIKLLKDKIEQQQIPNEEKPHEMIQITQETNQPTHEFDITSIHPYPPVAAHWRDPPELPAIHPFLNIGEVVDYIYRIVPRLQAHMSAMQAKIVENSGDITNKVDRSLVEKMFEKFQAVVSGLSKRVSELKEGYDHTPSRNEINSIVESMIGMITQESQTSIGRLKCIACGREIPQVTGAMSEDEAFNALGPVTNSTVFHVHSPANVGVRYGDSEHFDSEIVESPLSIRPNKISKEVILPLNQNSKKPK